MARPQRQRRVPSRFLGAEETIFSLKASGGTSVPQIVPQPPEKGRPTKKRRTAAVKDQAVLVQGAHSVPQLQVDTRSLVTEATAVEANASGVRASCSPAAPAAPLVEAAQDNPTPRAACTQPLAAIVDCSTSSDSSDVIMMEDRPSATSVRNTKKGEVSSTLRSSTLGSHSKSSCPDVAALQSSRVPPAVQSAPAAESPQCTRPEAQGNAPDTTPMQPDPLATSGEAVHDPKEVATHTVSFDPPPKTAAPLSAVGALSSPKDAAPLAPPQFQPLFDREDTPPRPDFAEDVDAGFDSCSDDGLDILAPCGRKGKKVAARRGPRGLAFDLSPFPSVSSPRGSAQGTPAQRPLPADDNDTSWLDLPPPDVPRGGGGGAAESATLLRLRQQRAELLALARGASLASDRIQAQSAAEARLREQEREREALLKEAEATARAEAVVAAALRVGQPQEDSDDAADEGGGVEETVASILVKVRASDGSQERFKIRTAEPLEKLFRAYLRKAHPGGIPTGAVFSFRFDGDPISDKQTPEELGLEDDDMIEVIKSK